MPTSANGCPAFGHYKPAEDGDGYVPWALQVLELSGGRLVHLHHFLDTERLFPRFGLSDRLIALPPDLTAASSVDGADPP